ncbi:unnamed protein product, partial [Anisakis simplex]|uniref:Dimer_Tnp_hAT domain-containing protein n=1 Tax=Anisakis simplex TaxID=6269 RepID=A0A0M3J5R3_ANISI
MNHHGSTLSTPHSSASATTRHTNSDDRYDEIIENEVCNRLIRLSCDKMVNSKHERGGAKLHRNLLILHLLRRARDEQK